MIILDTLKKASQKTEKLQLAYREWQEVSAESITEQREIIKRIAKHKQLLFLHKIEELVKAENLEQAKTVSTQFLQKIGTNALV